MDHVTSSYTRKGSVLFPVDKNTPVLAKMLHDKQTTAKTMEERLNTLEAEVRALTNTVRALLMNE